MRVVFLEDVAGVAQGGDVKEVKNGFARNYLIPQHLAVPATHNALQRVNRLKRSAEEGRRAQLADMTTVGEALDGVQVNVEMRAGPGGRLYGSVTPTIIAEELSRLAGREIDRRTVLISEPIRELGAFEVKVRLHAEVEPQVNVLVYATGTEPTVEQEAGETVEGEAQQEISDEVEASPEDPSEVAEKDAEERP